MASAENVGRILGRRCLEAGIECMDVLAPETGENSEKVGSFTSFCIDTQLLNKKTLFEKYGTNKLVI